MHRHRHERVHFFRGTTSPVRDVGVARAIDVLARLDAGKAVLVRDHNRGDAPPLHLHTGGHAVEEHAETVAVLLDERIGQQLEFVRVRNPDRTPILGNQVGPAIIDVLCPWLGRAHGHEQLLRNPFHHKAAARLVDHPVEVRQPNRGDDAAGKASPFDQQGLGAVAGGGNSGGDAGAAAAADQHVCLEGLHVIQ